MSVRLQDLVVANDEQVRLFEDGMTTGVTPKLLRTIEAFWVMSIPVFIITLLMGVSIALGWVNDIPAGSVSMFAYLTVGGVALLVFWLLRPFVGKPSRQ